MIHIGSGHQIAPNMGDCFHGSQWTNDSLACGESIDLVSQKKCESVIRKLTVSNTTTSTSSLSVSFCVLSCFASIISALSLFNLHVSPHAETTLVWNN
jgi:hypothetical protein